MSNNKYYKSKEFIKLQNKWYDKLSKSGFHDLEWLDQKTGSGQNTPYLKGNTNKFHHLSASQVSQRLEYFSACQDFLRSHEFPTRLHKFIWKLYIDGISYRKMLPKIAKLSSKKSPSIFWISVELNKLKHSFTLWQSTQPDAPDTVDQFMRDNRSNW